MAALLACRPGDDPLPPPRPKPESTAPYRADGRFIRDGADRAILLRGVNWSGNWKQPPYGADATGGETARIAALGLNSVRMLTHWAHIMPEEDRIDHDYLADFRRRVDLAAAADLLVVVDMHQDIFGYGIVSPGGYPIGNGAPAWVCSATVEPIEPWFFYYIRPGVAECYDRFYSDERLIDAFAEAFRAVIEAVRDQPAVIGFEFLNEPFWGSGDPLRADREVILPFYDRLYARLGNDLRDHLLFVEPAVTKNLFSFSNLDRLPGHNTVFAPHLYDPAMETGEDYAGDSALLSYRSDIDHREAEALDVPLWWGEWGNAPAGPSAERYVKDFAAFADARFTGWAYWDFPQLLRTDAPDGASHVARGLARAYVERAPGKPHFSFDPGTGVLRLEVDGDGQSETWVRAPKGWSFESTLAAGWSGAIVNEETGFLRIRLPAGPAGVRLHAELRFRK